MRLQVPTSATLLLGLLALGPLPNHAQESVPAGENVVLVRVVTEEGQLLERNPAAAVVRPGEPLGADAIRESLRELYQTGRFAEIRAEVASVEGGVRVDFVVRRNFYVNAIHISGLPEPPSVAQARAAMRLNLGEIFRESSLEEALERLRQTLQTDGLYEAQIRHELLPNSETRQMDVQVQIDPGPRARISRIEIRNQTSFKDEKLLGEAKLETGKTATSSRLDRAAGRIRDFLVKKDHLDARVSVRRGDYDPPTDTLPVLVEAVAGPKISAEVEGASISQNELRDLLPIYQEGAVDEDILREGRRNIRSYLEERGYFDPQVQYTVRKDADTGDQVITYQAERGPRYHLIGVAFVGNEYFSDEFLYEQLKIEPSGFFSRGLFSRRLFEEDAETFRALYLANGFREVEVTSNPIEGYTEDESDFYVRFRIREGPQTTVGELKLEGNQELSSERLLSLIDSQVGQPYSEFNVARDRDNLLALYYNEGFPEARFEAAVEPAEEANRVRLTYRIQEGPRFTVERVLIDGYKYTRRGIITRQVRLKPGEPLRQGQIVESQRRLYNLGIFNRVSIAPQNPEGTDTSKPLVVLVEESQRYTLAYGGGIEVQRLGSGGTDPTNDDIRASPRGLFEISKANLMGRAHTVSLRTRASSLQARALLTYTAPNFLTNPNFTLFLSGFADRTSDVRTFTSSRYEASWQLAQRVSNHTSLLYRYSFRRVLVDAGSLRVSPEEIPLLSQPTEISSVGLTWINDRRDNPADATRGMFNNVDISLAAKAIGSSVGLARLVLQNSSFHPLGGDLVFARSTRIGIQEPLSRTEPADIPLPERFFAGGGNSLRGFGLNQAGPRDPDTGFPVGGLAMLIFNQELRFPIRIPFVAQRLGGAVFYDAGNVFSRLNRITLRSSPPSPDDLNYFSHTVGIGFRYATPVGPVRLDLGYQINRAEFLVPDDAGGLRRESLPRFQFFLNFGSIF